MDESEYLKNRLDVSGAKYPIGLYASRDLAVVAGLILALYFGGSRLFLVTFIMRFATDLQDMILTYTVNEAETPFLLSLLLFVFLFATELLAIKTLSAHYRIFELSPNCILDFKRYLKKRWLKRI